MSHVIGKVYDVNKENMNKLIAELEYCHKVIEQLTIIGVDYANKIEALSGIKTHDTSDIVPDRE